MRKQRGLRLKQCAQCAKDYMGRKRSSFCSLSCAARSRPPGQPNRGSFVPGSTAWNAGAPRSGMTGRKHSDETKAKMRASSTGPLASNWKGGVTDENYRIRRSQRYAEWRTAVFVRDDYTCQECGARSKEGSRVTLNADHIKAFAVYPELRFDLSNGRTLCEPCHRKTPNWGAKAVSYTHLTLPTNREV